MNVGTRKCYLKPASKYKIKTVKAKTTMPVVKEEIGNKKKQCCVKGTNLK